MTPYYEQDGELRYRYGHEKVCLRMRFACSRQDGSRSSASVCDWSQPAKAKTNKCASSGYRGRPKASMADQAPSPANWVAHGRCEWLRSDQGRCWQRTVDSGARHRHGAHARPLTCSRRSGASHQRRPRRQQRSQSLSLPRPFTSQRRSPIRICGFARAASTWPCGVQGRAL